MRVQKTQENDLEGGRKFSVKSLHLVIEGEEERKEER